MKSKIQIQLVLVYVVSLLLIGTAVSLYTAKMIFPKMKQDVIENLEFSTSNTATQIESYFDNSDQVVVNMIYKGTLLEYIDELNVRKNLSGLDVLQYDRKFDNLIESVSTFPIIPSSHVTIYNKDLTYKYQYNRIKVSNIEEVLKDKNDTEYMEHYNRIICRTKKWDEGISERKTFSIIRLITNLANEKLGYIELQLDYQNLQHMLLFGNNRQAYIINQSGQMIYPDRNERENELEFLNMVSGDKNGIIQLGECYYAWEKVPSYDMIVAIKQDESSMFESMNALRRTTLLGIVALFLITLPIMYYFLNLAIKPIRQLTKQVGKISYSKMKLEVQENHQLSDEVKVLQESFTDMLERIRLSAEKEIFFQREQERLKYEALQKQISPHFLHNTLYVISIAAQEDRKEDVIAMCQELSCIMRYSMNMKKLQVTFEEELDYIQNYMKLQQENYGEDLSFTLNITDEWKSMSVPRMFLQPFVENSFKHGFGNCEPPYVIEISGWVEDGEYILTIEDNGGGISTITINEITEKMEQEDYQDAENIDSLGIVNTFLRLRYLYGDEAKIQFKSGKTSGTIIMIRIRR